MTIVLGANKTTATQALSRHRRYIEPAWNNRANASPFFHLCWRQCLTLELSLVVYNQKLTNRLYWHFIQPKTGSHLFLLIVVGQCRARMTAVTGSTDGKPTNVLTNNTRTIQPEIRETVQQRKTSRTSSPSHIWYNWAPKLRYSYYYPEEEEKEKKTSPLSNHLGVGGEKK